MFSFNPWADYLTILAPLIAGYYLFIGIRFYARDLKDQLSKRGRNKGLIPIPPQHSDVPDPPLTDPAAASVEIKQEMNSNIGESDQEDGHQTALWQNEDLFDQLELLATHLKEAIEEAHEKYYGKKDLLLLLQMTLKEYPGLHDRPFRIAIENLIDTECAKYGSIHLREEDKEVLWMQAA